AGDIGGAARAREHCFVVVEELVTRQQGHGGLGHLLCRLSRGDEGDIQREGDGHHPEDQNEVREEIEPGASFDHDLLPADGVILVVDLSVDVTELHHREQNDDEHQDDGLRRGGTDVQPLEAGGVNLIDQNGGGGAGPALRHDVNDGEG